MRARTARIAAAVVFVAGASLAVAGMAAAEEPDKCATNPFASGCELDLGIGPSASGSPDAGLLPGPGSETTETEDKNNNGNGKDGETSSSPPATTPPATDPGSSQPPAGSTPPPSGPPATTPPAIPATTPPASPPASSPGQQCDIARGGVDCGTETKSPSGSSGDSSGPQRNYGGGTTPSAGAAAAGSTGTPAGAGAELADTGQGANLVFVVVGGSAMAAGGFAFTVLPGRLNRRSGGAATA